MLIKWNTNQNVAQILILVKIYLWITQKSDFKIKLNQVLLVDWSWAWTKHTSPGDWDPAHQVVPLRVSTAPTNAVVFLLSVQYTLMPRAKILLLWKSFKKSSTLWQICYVVIHCAVYCRYCECKLFGTLTGIGSKKRRDYQSWCVISISKGCLTFELH